VVAARAEVSSRWHGSRRHLPRARVGGRLFESVETDAGMKIVDTGLVTAWEPPTRLVFEWRAVSFAPSEKTEVEVLFDPSPSGTLVTLHHRGWSRIRPDHPARHGLEVPGFIRMMGLWWGELMTGLREFIETRRSTEERCLSRYSNDRFCARYR